MATVTNQPVNPDTLITVKVLVEGSARKFKLPLSNLTASTLPEKLRHLLDVPSDQIVKLERYSDSAGAFIVLESDNPTVYKTLYRAAKAKLKLRLRVTLLPVEGLRDEPNQPNVPGSFVQPPCSSTANHTSPSPVPSAGSAVHWAAMAPAVVSSQETSSSVPTPSQTTNTPVGVRLSAASLSGEDVRTRAKQQYFAELSNISQKRDLALRLKDAAPPVPSVTTGPWSVFCNECDKPMMDEHFHCSICDDGDYDLCQECVAAGKVCPGANHWLIKRTLKDGRVVSSVTEKVAPKPRPQPQTEKAKENDMPGAFTDEPKAAVMPQVEPGYEQKPKSMPTRTCNSCVKVFEENNFVHCTSCDDYDLCLACHDSMKHGHHPAHEFKPVDPRLKLSAASEARCHANRNQHHAASCDGCDKAVFGVRHKCFDCPDYDLCSECIKNVQYIHKGHRFAPLYDALTAPRSTTVRHYGIYCDGPLCSGSENETFISGTRYKCTVCDDFDLCENCEALPGNTHDNSHPLLKFKTPFRNVNITTFGEDKDGKPLTMGDRSCRYSTGTATTPVPAARSHAPSNNSTATKVQTVADLKPTDEKASKADATEFSKKIVVPSPRNQTTGLETALPKDAELNAHFVRDTIPDGTERRAEECFTQVWTLRNPGPHAWPSGCRVWYVGGDNMFNLDRSHPASYADILGATKSNAIDRPVNVGEDVAFRIVMKAPKREGKSISYWRLKAPNAAPFGHRLWCDINVVAPPLPAATDSTGPPAAPAELGSTTEHIEFAGPSTRVPPPRFAADMHEELVRRVTASRKAKPAIAEEEIRDHTDTFGWGKATQKPLTASLAAFLLDGSERNSMIFPRLDKESPVPSVHEAAAPSTSTALSEETCAQSPKSDSIIDTESEEKSEEKQEVFEDVAEDLESLELASESDDDGFVTDEEYDILDASDEEFMQQAQQGPKN